MLILKGLNLALAFTLELALVCAAGYVGYVVGGGSWPGWLLAAALVAAVVLIWARWAAPRSEHRLSGTMLLALKAILFGAAAAGLMLAGLVWVGVALLVAAAVNLMLATVWDQVTA